MASDRRGRPFGLEPFRAKPMCLPNPHLPNGVCPTEPRMNEEFDDGDVFTSTHFSRFEPEPRGRWC